MEIFWKHTVSAEFPVNENSKTPRKLCASTKFYTEEFGEISAFYAVKLENWLGKCINSVIA